MCILLNDILDGPLPQWTVVLQVLQVGLCRNEATSVEISVLSTDQLCLANDLVTDEETYGANPREPGTQETLDVCVALLVVRVEH